MSTPEDVVGQVAARLEIQPENSADEAAVQAIEKCVGAPLPSLLKEWLLQLGSTDSASLEFDGEAVLFSDGPSIVESIEGMELEGSGVVPFAEDFFGSIWFLKTSTSDADAGGAVVLVSVQERYTDPENPVEHKCENFRQFLAGLTISDDE